MITGTTSSGFEFAVAENLKDDYRLIKAYKKAVSKGRDESVTGTVELVSCVFGNEDEEERFLQHLADENGRVPSERVYRELGEIIRIASEKDNEIKNS